MTSPNNKELDTSQMSGVINLEHDFDDSSEHRSTERSISHAPDLNLGNSAKQSLLIKNNERARLLREKRRDTEMAGTSKSHRQDIYVKPIRVNKLISQPDES